MYTHKDPAQLLANLAGQRIHRAESIEIYALDRRLIGAIVGRLGRRMAFTLTVAEHELFLSLGTETLSGAVVRHSLV